MYDIKNAQFVWRGITLSGFGDDHKYSITQNGDSVTPYKGVAGEGLRLGQSFETIADSYKNLFAAVVGAGWSTTDIQNVFSSV